RPWEYHNVLGGGTENAWRYFNNESVDLGQRADEMLIYIKEHVSPEEPLVAYWLLSNQMKAEKQEIWRPTPDQVGDGYVSGWLLVSATQLALKDWYMMPALKDVKPTDRIGNVFVYHGRFYLPRYAAGVLKRRADRLLEEKNSDKVLAEKYYLRAAELNP